ncbi:unnamed protein product [Darwinula stevensoni]|uniref:protein-serine/threonine phosphatase n=1 Tax=Darwinula stevensoni TaxID=69355 RepID=A0A7R9A019_9CRUS|nr:unnamed protein product [Darwinula stevensoni]CAG0884667.1 unnamed protein product [Darwinula stevensoni]
MALLQNMKKNLEKIKEKESMALQVVYKLLQPVSEEELLLLIQTLSLNYYEDVVEERALTDLCGYPLCSQCYEASKYLKEQLPKTAVWLKDGEKEHSGTPIVLLPLDKVKGAAGEEVLFPHPAKWQPEEKFPVVSKQNLSSPFHTSQPSDELHNPLDEPSSKPSGESHLPQNEHKDRHVDDRNIKETEPRTSTVGVTETEVNTKERQNAKQLAATSRLKANNEDPAEVVGMGDFKDNPMLEVERHLLEWFTVDTLILLEGRDVVASKIQELRNTLQQEKVSGDEWSPQSEIELQLLCYRLEAMDIDDLHQSKGYSDAMKEGHSLWKQHDANLKKVKAFFHGNMEEMYQEPDIKKDNDVFEPSLPIVDSKAQKTLRRKIVLEKINSGLRSFLGNVALPPENLSNTLKPLVSTFSLTSKNINLKPAQWQLLGLILLRMLRHQNVLLGGDFDESQKFISSILQGLRLDEGYLDRLKGKGQEKGEDLSMLEGRLMKEHLGCGSQDLHSHCSHDLLCRCSESDERCILDSMSDTSYEKASFALGLVKSTMGLCHQAVVDWFNLCRDVPACMWTRHEKMGGPGRIVQMDETLLRGKQKANKGRLLLGYREPEAGDESSEDADLVADVANVPEGRRNYGRRIEGPWVFGLAMKLDSGVVEQSGAHTQLIESLWTTLKLKVLKEMLGTTQDMKERYLIEPKPNKDMRALVKLEGLREEFVIEESNKHISLPHLKENLSQHVCGAKLLEQAFFMKHGKLLTEGTPLEDGDRIQMCFRTLGGKGGFGSMLRAIGAQIEKTTNHEACRDLSGRRLRDINEEKKLKNWLEKQAEREKEAEERRRQRLQRMLVEPKHEFNDPNYDKARSEIPDKIHDAVEQAFQKNAPATSGVKRPSLHDNEDAPPKKKGVLDKFGIGIDEEEMSEEDLSDEDGKTDDGVTGKKNMASAMEVDEDEVEMPSSSTSKGDKKRFEVKKELPKYCSEKDEPMELEKELESNICLLWDMTVEPAVAILVIQHGILDVITETVRKSCSPRLTEIAVGILGNICCHEAGLEKVKADQQELMQLIVALLSCTDSPTLVEVIRLLYAVVWREQEAGKGNAESNKPSSMWINLLYNEEAYQALVFILKSSTNEDLLIKTSQLLAAILNFEGKAKFFFRIDLVQGVLEAMKQFGITSDKRICEEIWPGIQSLLCCLNLALCSVPESAEILSACWDDVLKILNATLHHLSHQISSTVQRLNQNGLQSVICIINVLSRVTFISPSMDSLHFVLELFDHTQQALHQTKAFVDEDEKPVPSPPPLEQAISASVVANNMLDVLREFCVHVCKHCVASDESQEELNEFLSRSQYKTQYLEIIQERQPAFLDRLHVLTEASPLENPNFVNDKDVYKRNSLRGDNPRRKGSYATVDMLPDDNFEVSDNK